MKLPFLKVSSHLACLNNVKRKRFRFVKGYKTRTRVRKHYRLKKLFKSIGEFGYSKKIYNTDMSIYANSFESSYKDQFVKLSTLVGKLNILTFPAKPISLLKSYKLKSFFKQNQTQNPKLMLGYITLRARSKQAYTFQNLGMFLNALTLRNQRNPFTYKYIFKKKIFSFLYPNEVRNALMNRKKKITTYKLVYNFKKKLKVNPRFDLSSFNKLLLQHYKGSLQHRVGTNTSL